MIILYDSKEPLSQDWTPISYCRVSYNFVQICINRYEMTKARVKILKVERSL